MVLSLLESVGSLLLDEDVFELDGVGVSLLEAGVSLDSDGSVLAPVLVLSSGDLGNVGKRLSL